MGFMETHSSKNYNCKIAESNIENSGNYMAFSPEYTHMILSNSTYNWATPFF